MAGEGSELARLDRESARNRHFVTHASRDAPEDAGRASSSASNKFNLFKEQARLATAMQHNGFTDEQQSTVMQAFNFAAHHHLEHYRDSDDHMMVHLLTLAHRLLEHGGDERHVVGALLHDVVEEATASEDELKGLTRQRDIRAAHEAAKARRLGEVYRHFGDGIGQTVENLTQQSGEDFGSYSFRILHGGDHHAIAIKIHDVLHNIETISSLRPSRREHMLENYAKFFEVAARLDTPTANRIREGLEAAGLRPEVNRIGGYAAIAPSRLLPGWLMQTPIGERPLALVHEPVVRHNLVEVGMPFDEEKGWDRAFWTPRLKAIGVDTEGSGVVGVKKPDARLWPRKFGDRVYFVIELKGDGRDHRWLADQIEDVYKRALGH